MSFHLYFLQFFFALGSTHDSTDCWSAHRSPAARETCTRLMQGWVASTGWHRPGTPPKQKSWLRRCALVNGTTSKRLVSDGGLCSGHLLMMWSAVSSGSPHSHAALSASLHFFVEALYRPTSVRSLFRVVQCF